MFSQRYRKLHPYTPGEQPQNKKYIKLNTNENPYPPSPEVEKVLKNFSADNLRLYPDPAALKLREAIAENVHLTPENVFAGNGSDEILSFCFYAFFGEENGNLLFPEHTYSFYPVYCAFYGIPYKKVPLSADFEIDFSRFPDTENCSGVIFPNPNAPTGRLLSLQSIADFLRRFPENRWVIIDEAYIDFGGESSVPLISAFPNCIIVRTFSKSHSLAGMRLGYVLGSPEAVKALTTVKDSFNSYPIDRLAQKIGETAFRDQDYYKKINEKVMQTRQRISEELAALNWKVLPSAANFIFARKPGRTGAEIYSELKKAGILVRHFDTPGIQDFIRITIGTDADMDTFMKKCSSLF